MMKSSKQKIYDEVYGQNTISYEALSGVTGFLYQRLLKHEVSRHQVVSNLLPKTGGKILDLGCGNGDFVFTVKDKFAECYGVDVSPMRIKKAKCLLEEQHIAQQFHFDSCDIDEGTPFSESSFDAVTCISVLEHVFNPPSTIEEIYRILKPQGTFIVQVPNIAWLPSRFELLRGKLPMTGGVYSGADWEHLHNFTKPILSRLLEEKGFTIQKIVSSGVFAKYRNWWLSALGSDIIIKCIKSSYT